MTHTSQPDTATVRAVGKLTEALEVVEEARGHLYAFHRLTGTADFTVEEAIGMLRDAGHHDLASRLDRELLGRNVLPGRWTYQVVEDYEDTYYSVFHRFAAQARALTPGQRHAYEAMLKRTRRTRSEPGHEPEPGDVPDPDGPMPSTATS
ncbi:hypothetical protein [Saccharomonospora sp.]|uniref:hypothetical protein n=1 Tax=Saccharomonospora sp. TaxID=33913 RepID=UPI00262F88BF|nr:hypothetical protein [Saccharomonospora sp.]